MKRNKFLQNRKSQITFFILAGILMLLIAALAIYLGSEKTIKAPQLQDVESIKFYVNKCIKNKAESILDLVGIQGGYVVPDDYLDANYSKIGYGFFNGESALPTIQEIEAQINKYFGEEIQSCSNATLFPGFDVSLNGYITVNAKIVQNDVIIKIDYPLRISKGATIVEPHDFETTIPVRLGNIHSILTGIINKTLEDEEWIDLAYLSGFDVKITILPYDKNSIVYSIEDKRGAKTYTFLSAFKFKPNLAPVIDIQGKIELKDGVHFSKKIGVADAEGDDFSCSDDTALFDITQDCFIEFTPEIPGTYNVTITAVDAKGNLAKKDVIFEVNE